MKHLKKYIRYLTEYPLIKLDDIDAKIKIEQNIPNTVYQTWENKLFGRTHFKEILKFRNLNPELNFKIFDSVERNTYMKKEWKDHPISKIFSKTIYGPMKSDIFRYCILFDRGGYYFDISKGCKVPLISLHNPSSTALITYDVNELYLPPDEKIFNKLNYPTKFLVQWGFGFSKKHKILKDMIDSIVKFYPHYKNITFENPKHAILSLTGPGMFTKVVRNYFDKNECKNISQTNIFFNNEGIFKMRGSGVRHYSFPSYTDLRNKKICN